MTTTQKLTHSRIIPDGECVTISAMLCLAAGDVLYHNERSETRIEAIRLVNAADGTVSEFENVRLMLTDDWKFGEPVMILKRHTCSAAGDPRIFYVLVYDQIDEEEETM